MPVPKSAPVVNPPKQTTDRYLLVEPVEGRDELFKQGVSAIEALSAAFRVRYIKMPRKSADSQSPRKGPYLTTSEVCGLLRIGDKTLQRWRNARKLTFIQRGGRFLFPAAEIDRFLESRTVRAA